MIKYKENNVDKQEINIELIPVIENNEFDFIPMYAKYAKELSVYSKKLKEIYANCTYEEGAYNILSYYFSNSERYHIYLIDNKEGIYIGFCIVADYPLNKENKIFPKEFYSGAYDIAEFYILPEYRRKGYGGLTFNKIIKIYKTKGTLSILNKNIEAKKFWNKMFDEYAVSVLCAASKENEEICEYSFLPNSCKL
jgi:predicted acetyltransferase